MYPAQRPAGLPNPFEAFIQLLLLPIQILGQLAQGLVAPGQTRSQEDTIDTTEYRFLEPIPAARREPQIIEVPVQRRAQPAAVTAASTRTSTYENEERVKITWNDDGLPDEIVIHRRATRT